MKAFFLSVALLILAYNSGVGKSVLPAYFITSDSTAYITLPDSCWQMIPDPQGTLNLNRVLYSSFQNANKKINYKNRVYWLRFRLTNSMSKDVKIALPESAARIDLYTRLNGGKWHHATTGTMVRWSKREGLNRIPAFTLTIPAGATLTAYKRIDWNYVAAQPDSMSVYFAPAEKLIMQNYVKDESTLMTSIQDAFILGLFILTMIISFYFFLVVREKEFLYFSLYLLVVSLQSIPTLGDVFLREYPRFLLYLYIFTNSFMAFMLIHFLRHFLKTPKRFPWWDRFLILFSFLLAVTLLASHFASSVFQVNLATPSHFSFNLAGVVSGVIVLATLFLYLRDHDKATRLMIIALTPVLCLKVLVYTLYVIYGLYSPGFGEPTLHGYVLPFSKIAFLILILCFLWMTGFFNWLLFLRFSDIRKALFQQTTLDHLKSRFFANISHEFRTPLTLIIGPLEDVMQGGDPKKMTALVPEMHRNSKRLLQLINQLLDLSRLDTGNYHINTTREDIIPFVRQVVHSFSSLAERRNISLETEADSMLRNALQTEPDHFYFDEDIVEKVLANLLSNAFKFTPDGGEIFVSLGLYENRRTYLEMKVEDTGKGIPEEKLAYIFDRFYQADHSIKTPHEGSGIGLSLVKELIELHQGKITLSSRLDRGTIFTCLLPFNKKIVTDDAPNKKSQSSPAENFIPVMEENTEDKEHVLTLPGEDKPLILVVEDHMDVRKYIVEKLQGDYTVMEAKNGDAALEKALNDIPDLVVSDVMMPKMDGFELCKRLKTDDRTSHIPVILLTARAEDSDKITGLETGADAYLIKPFNSQELLTRVHHLIMLRNKMRAKFSGKLIIKPGQIAVTPRDRQFMQKISLLVESHIDDSQFSVEQLAGAMNMSLSQIYRKIKALINQSPQQFIRSIRMQRALDLLKNDAGTVSEIAWKTGFEDAGYFSKVFKRHFGCLPTEKEKFPV